MCTTRNLVLLIIFTVELLMLIGQTVFPPKVNDDSCSLVYIQREIVGAGVMTVGFKHAGMIILE